ncbi:tyrosinase family oxidase copper chaperone [Streptomyces sp. NPDC004082]|uniref:tyrosinase family oxidase copper chaperone n=1 Tax=unclassified Streptomyces TaxID=2593676 RepID=UPI0033AEA6B7
MSVSRVPVTTAGPVEVGNRTRRNAMRALFASLVAVSAVPVVAASRPSGGDEVVSDPHDVADTFEETYRGRRIHGVWSVAGRAAYDSGQWQVTVDGRPLHLMRRADGSYLSMVDHYESYPTPLAAARAAVDVLGASERLRGPATGGRHDGVHA